MSPALAEAVIALRQIKKLSLGESIIAATALEYRLPLAARNIEDISWSDGLEVLNPDEAIGDGMVP